MYSTVDKQLTMAEKRELIERITDLVKNNVINRDDRRDIYCVCLAACDRELGKIRNGGKQDGI